VIREEYRRMWRALAPLLNDDVVPFGFDLNCASRIIEKVFCLFVGLQWLICNCVRRMRKL
jgi:hypothetical protein